MLNGGPLGAREYSRGLCLNFMIIEVDECNFVNDCSYQLGDGNEQIFLA